MLVPETIGELIDQIGWMVLTAPEFQSTMAPNGNIDIAFEELSKGIEHLCPKFGEQHCADLHSIADESKALLEEGKLKEGAFRLQDIRDFLIQKKWK